MKRIFFVLICLAFLNSCKKNEETNFVLNKPETSESISNNTVPANSIQSSIVSGPYSQIFNQIDPISLQSVINTNNTSGANYIINLLTDNISNLYYSTHETSLLFEFNGDRNKVLLFGLFWAKKEQSIVNYADPGLDCLITAVSSFIGITQAKSIWASIVAGASAETVVAALKLIGKRVAGVISVAIMIWDAGSCFDWW